MKSGNTKLRTPSEVRQDFVKRGVSIADWARKHQVPAQLVYDILNGKRQGLRGSSHKIAVLLGLKDGLIEGDPEFIVRTLRVPS